VQSATLTSLSNYSSVNAVNFSLFAGEVSDPQRLWKRNSSSSKGINRVIGVKGEESSLGYPFCANGVVTRPIRLIASEALYSVGVRRKKQTHMSVITISGLYKHDNIAWPRIFSLAGRGAKARGGSAIGAKPKAAAFETPIE
jgi:hypothetical protein